MSGARYTRRMQKLTADYKQACMERDDKCWLCSGLIDYDGDGTVDDYAFHLDHYWPWSTHPHLRYDPDNFRPSHRLCNIRRGEEPPRPELGTLSREWLPA